MHEGWLAFYISIVKNLSQEQSFCALYSNSKRKKKILKLQEKSNNKIKKQRWCKICLVIFSL
jgi:hypothetical protein